MVPVEGMRTLWFREERGEGRRGEGQHGGGGAWEHHSAENLRTAEMGGPAGAKEISSLPLGTRGTVLLQVTWRIPH